MKLNGFILIFISLAIPLAYGEQVLITPVDFSVENPQLFRLSDGDGISFQIEEKEYVITIDAIGKTSVRLKSFGYNKEERSTFYIPLIETYDYKLDFNKDDIYDIKVGLIRVETEESKAVIYFEKIDEPKYETSQATGNVTSNEFFNLKGALITALIIVLGLVAYFTFRKK